MIASSGHDVFFGAGLKRTDGNDRAESVAAISRDTMVWRRSTVEAAITTGSTLACGIEAMSAASKHPDLEAVPR